MAMPPDPRVALLPGQLRPVAEICGFDAVERLIAKFGGRRVYVPKIAASAYVGEQCGIEVAEALRRCYGGEYVVVPLARALATARKHADIRNDPRPASDVARAFRMSVNSVHRIRGQQPPQVKVPPRPRGRPRQDLGIVDLEALIAERAGDRRR